MSVINSKNTGIICEAAIRLFKEKGYANVSVSDICREANTPRSSFYSIFSSKDDIIIYAVKNLKNDSQAVFGDFVNARNDLERIWMLYDRYLKLAVEFGPELTGSLLAVEITRPVGIIDLFYTFNDWFTILVRNCQQSGLIRNKTQPEKIVDLGVRIALAAAYEWCRTCGSFDLRKVALEEHEALYDVPPEYRHSLA